MNLNKVFLIGNLTRDPESRALPSGQAVSNFGLATNRIWTDSETKERQQQVEFHNIVAFGRLAEICNQYLSKGSLVMIEGRIQTRTWQDQNGDTKYRTEIITESMQMGPKGTRADKTEKGKEVESEEKKEIEEVQIDETGEEKPSDEVKTEDIPF